MVMVRWQTVIWGGGGGGGGGDCASDFHLEVSSKCYFCRLLSNIRPIANSKKSVHAFLHAKQPTDALTYCDQQLLFHVF